MCYKNLARVVAGMAFAAATSVVLRHVAVRGAGRLAALMGPARPLPEPVDYRPGGVPDDLSAPLEAPLEVTVAEAEAFVARSEAAGVPVGVTRDEDRLVYVSGALGPRCGDSGGRTKAGQPCASRAVEQGRCRRHPLT